MKPRRVHVISAMTPFPHTVEDGESLETAKRLMYEHGFHHLPVTHDENLIGVLSDRDVKVAFAVNKDGRELLVRDACSYDPYIVDVHERLQRVAGTMAKRRIDSALVTKEGKLVGIFTSTDACRLLAEELGPSDIPDQPA